MQNNQTTELITAIATGDLKKLSELDGNQEWVSDEIFKAAFLYVCDNGRIHNNYRHEPLLVKQDWAQMQKDQIEMKGKDGEYIINHHTTLEKVCEVIASIDLLMGKKQMHILKK